VFGQFPEIDGAALRSVRGAVAREQLSQHCDHQAPRFQVPDWPVAA
jgi:hypothetical protein